MKMLATFNVNGRDRDTVIAPHMTLADVLRDQLRLTGTKRACTGGNCGACTVLMDGVPVCSCIQLAVNARDRKIETVEGLAKPGGDLSALQEAFARNNAAQCGFCTSGMLMTAEALLRSNPRPTREEVKVAISGNICRCTGYVKIVDAIMEATAAAQEAAE
ncbi:(2Fe-2S)-binding protein [Frigidibacter sp. SD6-1]|uniref:(2Fe-2S)-binding protein n=1 Tax=Frigidibacter sp. SD6-1 TaxID=3032581 RepID=UPI0024DF705D|nr:(2Fe-2S)-binding protein [Frigidibacter sp. SD6-1]